MPPPSMPPQHTQPFPPTLMMPVSDYKKMAADYATIQDPTVKASYKTVLDAKIVSLRDALAAYAATASAAIDALQVA